ncbi:MAG: DUF4105 domain-containing protein [Vicinamibacterales bacterium]
MEGRKGRAPALTRLVVVVAGALVAALGAWSALALWIDGPRDRVAAGLLVAACVAAIAFSLARVRPPLRALAAALVPAALVLVWWLRIPPSNARDWQPDVARTPTAEIQDGVVTLSDVRHFAYRSETDFSVRWETRRIELDKVAGLDLFVSFWGPTLYAHTILSWDIEGAPPLAASIETRKEKGESYSALRGFFRQYEIVYVLADERDVVQLRTGFRGEEVHLYRLTTPPARARALLLSYLEEANELARKPAWYNALTLNCTTAIWHNLHAIAPDVGFDWRLLANGYIDELAYAHGTLDRRLPLAELRARGNITAQAKRCAGRDDFSSCIREGVPLPPPRR